MNNLHVYYDEESDWVIAESAEEAKKVLMEAYGLEEDEVSDHWTQLDDEEKRSIRFEDDSELKDLSDDEANDILDAGGGWKTITKTNREWILSMGKGILCSSEF